MSELNHYSHEPQEILKDCNSVLDKTTVEMGRTNSRDDRVDRQAVNEEMIEWWAGKRYRFP